LYFFSGLFVSVIVIDKNRINFLNDKKININIEKDDIIQILYNNLHTISLTFLGGFTMATLTSVELMFNGMMIGGLFLVLPTDIFVGFIVLHGIFEIPAIIIAGAAGFKIPYEIIRYLAGKKEQILTKKDVKEYLILALISILIPNSSHFT